MAMRMASEALANTQSHHPPRSSISLRSTDSLASAWALDAAPFHHEFGDLFTGLIDDRGLARFRTRATEIWHSDDPGVARYIEGLATHTPEEWSAGFEERHLAEWYRVLMVPYLRPIQGFAAPVALKDGLPRLGWTPSEARRLAWGRELATLPERYGIEECAAALAIVLGVGNKGWLSREDAQILVDRFQHMDPRAFRDLQDLVVPVEDAYAVLSAIAGLDEDIVILPPR